MRKIKIFFIGLFFCFAGYFLFKVTYSNVTYNELISFDYSLNVDSENKVIKHLTSGTTVADFLKNVTFTQSGSYNMSLTDSALVKKDSTDTISTGDILVIDNDGTEIDQYVLSVLADANGDGEVNGSDLVLLRKHIVEYKDPETGVLEVMSGVYKEAVDISGDGVINSLDIVRIRKTIVGVIEPTNIKLNIAEADLIVGSTLELNYAILPNNVNDNAVTWSSSDESVATVLDGMVTVIKEGVVTITVKTSTGLTDKCVLTVKEKKNTIIDANIDRLRDPFVLVEDGIYYIYGTSGIAYKNVSGSLDGTWEYVGQVVEKPSSYKGDLWAPEVYKYNGGYYMFITYLSSVTDHRGVTVMYSESPLGPFEEISSGHVTPDDWDAIDGTLYIDKTSQPWMIFVHEHTSLEDGIGRMVAAKLSSDLSSLISEPIELFRADDPTIPVQNVTDGCFMYETKDGQLLMLWSNFDKDWNYFVAIARSKDGTVTGEWQHDDELLYSKNDTFEYDGGHGMIFTDTDGQMYLSIHSPNEEKENHKEKPKFIPIYEENGTLKIVK